MITSDADGNRIMGKLGANKTQQLELLDDMVKYCRIRRTADEECSFSFETFDRRNCGSRGCIAIIA